MLHRDSVRLPNIFELNLLCLFHDVAYAKSKSFKINLQIKH